MSDKDVTRNVRSSGQEGIKTPTQKHYHSISEKDNVSIGEDQTEKNEKDKLLQKFRNREKSWKKSSSKEKDDAEIEKEEKDKNEKKD